MKIDLTNYKELSYDVFQKFSTQWAVACAGELDDYRCLTLGWGMMGNLWSHPGSALTIYVTPARATWEYLQKEEYFTVSFFPEEYREDLNILGTKSSRDCDKVALTKLTPKVLSHGVGFEEANLTFVCRKVYAHQFELDQIPEEMAKGMYSRVEPHWLYIGFVEDVEGNL